jgi:hypothetical protein
MCQPVYLVGGTSTRGIAVDSADVYWIDDGGNVRKGPLSGGSSSTLCSVPNGGQGIAVLGSTLYFTDFQTNVWTVSTSGGTPTKVTSIASGTLTSAIAVDATNVYFTTWHPSNPGFVYQVPLAGGSATQLGSGLVYPNVSSVWPAPFNVAVGGGYVYWTNPGATSADNSGTVVRAPIGGSGTPQTLASGQAYPWAIALDANDNVYWTNLGTKANNYADGSVMKLPSGGATPAQLASGLDGPNVLAVDATGVYFGYLGPGTTGIIAQVPLGGAASPTVLTMLSTGLVAPAGLALDATYVYWTEDAVYKVAK